MKLMLETVEIYFRGSLRGIFEVIPRVEKGETCRFRLPKLGGSSPKEPQDSRKILDNNFFVINLNSFYGSKFELLKLMI